MEMEGNIKIDPKKLKLETLLDSSGIVEGRTVGCSELSDSIQYSYFLD
jgi:hypothetical protein